jgi:hypothetical protein
MARVRVKLGKVGPNPTDYGLQVWDAAGNLLYSLTGCQENGIALGAVTTPKLPDGAINGVAAAMTTAGVACSTAGETQVQSVTISTDGGSVLVHGKVTGYGTVSNMNQMGMTLGIVCNLMLKKGSSTGPDLDIGWSVFAAPVPAWASRPVGGVCDALALDSSPGNPQTYVLTVLPSMFNLDASYRMLYAQNTKR